MKNLATMLAKTIPFNGLCLLVVCASIALASGCASQPRDATDEVRITATPKATPQRTITNFSNALRCMDDLFIRYNISNVSVGAQDIPDSTEIVSAGTKDMLITALSNMSARSRAIRFVALGSDLQDITRFHQLHPRKSFRAPDFFIRGAITQVDQGVLESQARVGVALADALSLSASADRIASIVSLDLNLGLVSTLQMVPAVSSSNSIAVIRRGAGASATGAIQKLGLLFEVDFARSEGLHHATRTLVDLGTIELMGRLAQVPYWECLDIRSTNPKVQQQVKEWYDALEQSDLAQFVQAKLKALGHFRGTVNGVIDARTREAIGVYKSRQGLVANGDLDYQLYYQLLNNPVHIDPAYVPQVTELAQTTQSLGREPLQSVSSTPTALDAVTIARSDLSLTTDRGPRPVYRAGDALTLTVRTETDAHVYCYYEPEPGQVVKVFPNRFTPESLRTGGEAFRIPDSDDFSIRLDRAGAIESFLCLSSREDLEQTLPGELRDKALVPISLASLSKLYRRQVNTAEDIYRIYKDSAPIVPLKRSLKVKVQ